MEGVGKRYSEGVPSIDVKITTNVRSPGVRRTETQACAFVCVNWQPVPELRVHGCAAYRKVVRGNLCSV